MYVVTYSLLADLLLVLCACMCTCVRACLDSACEEGLGVETVRKAKEIIQSHPDEEDMMVCAVTNICASLY